MKGAALTNNVTTAAKQPEARADVPQQAGDNTDSAGQKRRSAGIAYHRNTDTVARSGAANSQAREDSMLTIEQFDEAIVNNIKLPAHLLPWTRDFDQRFGRDARQKYADIKEMMDKYSQSMKTRSAAKLEEQAELQEHLRECRAKWRRNKRKEQGKKMRGCRGQGQQRKLSRAAKKAAVTTVGAPVETVAATEATHENPGEIPEISYEHTCRFQRACAFTSRSNPKGIQHMCNQLWHAIKDESREAAQKGFQPTPEFLEFKEHLHAFYWEYLIDKKCIHFD